MSRQRKRAATSDNGKPKGAGKKAPENPTRPPVHRPRQYFHANKHPEWELPLTSKVSHKRLKEAQRWVRGSVDTIERFLTDARDPGGLESLAKTYEDVRYYLDLGQALRDDLAVVLDQGVSVSCWGTPHTSFFAVLLGSLSNIDATREWCRWNVALRGACPTGGAEAEAQLVQQVELLKLPRPRAYVTEVLAELSRAATGRPVYVRTVTLEAEPVVSALRIHLPADDKARAPRPAYERDHTFLEWAEKLNLKPAAIRSRWNAAHDKNAQVNVAVVNEGLKKARRERASG
jgi:hypothetical protein